MYLLPIVLASLSLSKPHRKFLTHLWPLLLAQPGRANFSDLIRFGGLCTRTYTRWYDRDLHFPALNLVGLQTVLPADHLKAWVLDGSFIPKSGKHTHGLGQYWNGRAGGMDKGLEISLLACLDIDAHCAYGVSVRQTDPAQITPGGPRPAVTQGLAQLAEALAVAPRPAITYVVADGAYSTQQFLDGVEDLGLHHVGKLPRNAHLRYRYTGPQARRGRPRVYGDRFTHTDLSQLTPTDLPAEGVTLYHGVLHHRTFQRWVPVVSVLPLGASPAKTEGTLLFSTDADLAPDTLYHLYRARFQIEFLFRDAKQHLGLNHCQARSSTRLHFHFNVILAALTWAKLEQRYQQGHPLGRFSLANVTRQAFNRHLLERFIATLAPGLNSLQSRPEFQTFCQYGQIVPAGP